VASYRGCEVACLAVREVQGSRHMRGELRSFIFVPGQKELALEGTLNRSVRAL